MKLIITSILLLLISAKSVGQEAYKMKGNNEYTEIDILSSYYEQDGNNAAVTGGVGTEALTDVSTIIVINVPLDSEKSINASFGADYYTSASTDNIDNNKSSASSKDVRSYVNIGYTHKLLDKGLTFGGRLGYSGEYDYTSINGGFDLTKEFNSGNSEISFTTQAFIDQWEIYFPRELRREVSVPTTSRNSFSTGLTFSQVVNKRLQFALSAEAVYMQGLLSTPFHRVYFSDKDTPDIERLPSNRLKIPVSVRATYFPLDKLVLRGFYRFYTDDFGIVAHSLSLETVIKLSDVISFSPFYRYHKQTASDYFAPFESHNSSLTYYTSDYDLSRLSSNKLGIEIGYKPLYGVSRLKIPFTKKIFKINSLRLRTSRYIRDTGLDAYSIALAINCRV